MQKPVSNLLDHTPVGIFFIDKNGDCAYVNQTWCQITGLLLEDIKPLDWLQAIHPSDQAEYKTAWKGAFENWLPFTKNHRFVLPNGSIVFVTAQSFPVGKKGAPDSGYIGTITKQSNPIVQPGTTQQNNRHSIQFGSLQVPHLKVLSNSQNSALTREESSPSLPPADAYLKALNSTLNDATYTLSNSNIILLANNHLSALSTNSPVGCNAVDILPREVHLKHIEKMTLVIERKKTQSYSFLTVNPRGETLCLKAELVPILSDRQCDHVLLKISPEQNIPAHQHDHSMLSAIANQLNYAVNSINSCASRTLNQLASHQLSTEELTHLQQGIVQQADAIEETLFGVRQTLINSPQKNTPYNINQLINDLCEQIITSKHPLTTVGLKLEQQPPSLSISANRLKYVLQQLLVNALEACHKTTQPTITIQTQLKGNLFTLTVHDNGAGIADKDRYLVFEPFFSTKRQQGGLGLSISRSIVEGLQGSLQVLNNTLSTGATLQLTLPVINTQ